MTIERISELPDGVADRRLWPFSGMTDGQLKRGEGFRRDNPEGMFIGESQRVIERALDAGVQPLSLFVEETWQEHDAGIIERFERDHPEIPVFLATTAQFHELTGYQVTRGSLACFARPQLPSLDQVLDGASRVAVLEDVTNYANMGAIFRSAAALGIDAVLISPSCHDPLYRRAARVSMGAVFQVPWTRIGSAREWAQEGVPLLRERGFTTVAMALRGDSVALDGPKIAEATAQGARIALVLGTEGEGLFNSTIAACDYTVTIPMAHGVDSLNVAAASAIAFWELRRQSNAGKDKGQT